MIRRRFRLSVVGWPGVVLLLVPGLVLAAVLGLFPLRDAEYWWHLAVGRLVDDFGRVPAANHFVFTADPGAPSFIQPWLGQWLSYRLHEYGGVELTLLLRNAMAAVALTVGSFVTARHAGVVAAAFGGLVAGLVSVGIGTWTTVEPGPLMFALVPLALLVVTGVAVRAGRWPWPALLVFPAVAALWANLAPGFVWPAVLAAGFGVSALVFRRLPADSHSRREPLLWAATALASFAALAINPRDLELFAQIPADVAAGGGLSALFVVFAPLVLEPSLADAVLGTSRDDQGDDGARAPFASGWVRAAIVVGALAIAAAAVATQPVWSWQPDLVRRNPHVEVRPTPPLEARVLASVPVECVEIFRSSGKQVRVYHPREHAGMLLYRLLDGDLLWPAVFFDPREGLVPPEIEALDPLIASGGAGRGVFQQFGVNAVIADNERHARLIEELGYDAEWQHVLETDHHTCFMRR